MKRLVGFSALFTVLALTFAVASCASIKWPTTSAYSEKAQSGLRPKNKAADKKKDVSEESHMEHHAVESSHADHHQHHHADGGIGCAARIERGAADIPDLLRPRWVPVAFLAVTASENLDFHYFFFHDTARPALGIAAMTADSFQNKGRSPVTGIRWEVGDDIRSASLKTNEPVCVNPIVSYNGERLGLAGLYQRLKKLATVTGSLPNAQLP